MKKFKTLKQFLDMPVGSIGTQESNNTNYTFRYDGYRYHMSNDVVEFLTEYFEEIKEEQIDFSKFIGRCNTELCIKWDKCLKSLSDWDITYSNINRDIYTDPISYTECTLSDLKYWDVYIYKSDNEKYKQNYKIYLFLSEGKYMYQQLTNVWCYEFIDYWWNTADEECYKFNRN